MGKTFETEQDQQVRYEALEKVAGESLALFYCCIAFDVPFDLEAISRDESEDKWLAYLDNLHLQKRDVGDEGEPLGFLDGLTDIVKIFGGNLKEGEFSRAVSADYDELDRTYQIMANDLINAGGVSSKQEFILRRCAKRTLEMDRMEKMGFYDKAMKLSKLIDADLASEQLRKKDAKPVEDFRIDSWAGALEKAGLMKNGKYCDPDEMFRILFGRLPKYPYTNDAAEQMLLINENRMRNNDGMPELTALPDGMRLQDDLGEFAQEQGPREREAYEALGLVKLPEAGAEKRG